jgi:glycerophosphoryl diester phosphodiesterase
MAHRGSRELWPENTMTAFAGAVELGYRYIETDVRMTADGVVVAFHDATLERTTNGRGAVVDWRWEELQHLDAGWAFGADLGHPLRGRGVRIPRLDEVFAAWPDVHFNIDLKAPGIEWAVAEVIAKAHRQDSTLIGSFRDRRIAKFRRITNGTIATSAGPRGSVAAWMASRTGRGIWQPVAAYQLPFETPAARLDRRFVEAAHSANAQVHAWTVNDAVDMEHLLDIGVDGIITDRPDVLNDLLRQRGVKI